MSKKLLHHSIIIKIRTYHIDFEKNIKYNMGCSIYIKQPECKGWFYEIKQTISS